MSKSIQTPIGFIPFELGVVKRGFKSKAEKMLKPFIKIFGIPAIPAVKASVVQ